MEYRGNLLSTEFSDKNFLNSFDTIEKRKSKTDSWVHYLVRVQENELEETITSIQKNLIPGKYYAHLYNEAGNDVIVIFPNKVFRLDSKDKAGWVELKSYMLSLGIPERQTDTKPKRFSEEIIYYSNKPLIS